MAYKITSECAACGSCELECPNQAISQGDVIYQINADKCTECIGFHKVSKCAEICPLSAPVPDPAHKENKEQLIAKFKKIHPGKNPANL